jgi:hypothetical protein
LGLIFSRRLAAEFMGRRLRKAKAGRRYRWLVVDTHRQHPNDFGVRDNIFWVKQGCEHPRAELTSLKKGHLASATNDARRILVEQQSAAISSHQIQSCNDQIIENQPSP